MCGITVLLAVVKFRMKHKKSIVSKHGAYSKINVWSASVLQAEYSIAEKGRAHNVEQSPG